MKTDYKTKALDHEFMDECMHYNPYGSDACPHCHKELWLEDIFGF